MSDGNKNQINLGDEVRDTICNFTGICTSISTKINGEKWFLIEGNKMQTDGKFPESGYLPGYRLELVKANAWTMPAGSQQVEQAGRVASTGQGTGQGQPTRHPQERQHAG